jgi:peptide/nickel transport system permease protein
MRRVAWLVAGLFVAALAAPQLAPYDPEQHFGDFLSAPPMRPRVVDAGSLHVPFVRPVALADRMTLTYTEDPSRTLPLPWFGNETSDKPVFLLGADSFGRDQLSRLLFGARVSLSLALTGVLGALVLGAVIGAFAGYRGGWLDNVLMRTADFVIVLPVIYVALVLRALMPLVLEASTVFALMAGIFVLAGWPFIARSVRGLVVAERDQEYVIAAQSIGASTWRVIGRHLLPACGEHLVVQGTLLLPAFVLAEATLSFVGLGFPERIPTWGTMLHEAASLASLTRFPWLLAPAAAIYLVVLSVNAVTQSDKISTRPI